MANANSSSKKTAQKNWDFDTADHFTLRLDEIRAVLTALMLTIGDNQDGANVTTDEVIVLTVQRIGQSLLELETLAYELDHSAAPNTPNASDIAIPLMRARAMVSMLEDKFNVDSWQITFADHVLVSYFAAVRRLTEEASAEATKIHRHHFQKAA